MKSIVFFSSALLLAVESALLPLEHSSSSSVKVKQNGNEYSYNTLEKKEVALETLQPLPVIPIIQTAVLNGQPHQQVLINEFKTNDDIKEKEKVHDQEQLKEQIKSPVTVQEQSKLQEAHLKVQPMKEKSEKPREQFNIIPGYKLLAANDLLIEYPYFNPHVYGYAYHYPHLRIF